MNLRRAAVVAVAVLGVVGSVGAARMASTPASAAESPDADPTVVRTSVSSGHVAGGPSIRSAQQSANDRGNAYLREQALAGLAEAEARGEQFAGPEDVQR